MIDGDHNPFDVRLGTRQDYQPRAKVNKRWLGCGIPPKPGNDIVLHNIKTVRGDPEKKWPVDIVQLKKEVVQLNYDRYTHDFAKAQNRERQRAYMKSSLKDKIPKDPRD